MSTLSPVDLSRATSGAVFIPLASGANPDYAYAVAVQADGRIVAAGHGWGSGSGSTDIAVTRRLADGAPDPSFGGGSGQVLVDIAGKDDLVDSATLVAVQPDGRILVGGHSFDAGKNENNFAVVRLNPDGSLDSSFGSGTGKVSLAVNAYGNQATSLVLQPDGRILLSGTVFNSAPTGNDFAAVRLESDGSLDRSFGNGTGKAVLLLPQWYDSARSLNLQADGKIVLAGNIGGDFAIARLQVNGTLDTGFGSGGVRQVSVDRFGLAVAHSSVLQPDGKILVAGLAYDEALDNDPASDKKSFAVVRVTAGGEVDASFGSNGRVLVRVGDQDSGHSLLLQPDGRIVVAGFTRFDPEPFKTGDTVFAAIRLNADGTLDSGFGQGGRVAARVGSGNAEGLDVALQPDGRIVIAGDAVNPDNRSGHDAVLLRLEANGTVDSSFGAAMNTITGTPGNDRLIGSSRSEAVDGGAGVDTLVLLATRANASVAASATGHHLSSPVDGSDTLVGVERLQFIDQQVALDLAGKAGDVALTLGAVFGRESVANPAYVGIGLHHADAGLDARALVQFALDARFGVGASAASVVGVVFENVVGRAPLEAERDYFAGLVTPTYPLADLVLMAAGLDLNKANIGFTGLADHGLDYLPWAGA